jgi:hypothetical protein
MLDEYGRNARGGRKRGFLYDLRVKSSDWVKEGKRMI